MSADIGIAGLPSVSLKAVESMVMKVSSGLVARGRRLISLASSVERFKYTRVSSMWIATTLLCSV